MGKIVESKSFVSFSVLYALYKDRRFVDMPVGFCQNVCFLDCSHYSDQQIQRSFSSASYNPPCLAYLDAQKNRSAFRKPVLTSCSCLLRRTFCLLTCDSRFAGRAFFRILAARFVKRAICAVQHRQCFAAILLCIVRKAIRFFFIHSDHILRSRFRPASANRFMAYTAGASTPL